MTNKQNKLNTKGEKRMEKVVIMSNLTFTKEVAQD